MSPSSPTSDGDAAVLFADWAAALTYESLPKEVVVIVKSIILDTLGTTLAANTLGVGSQQILRLVLNAGGSPQSSILGFKEKVPAMMAALANGAMAHALNYDDIGEGGGHMASQHFLPPWQPPKKWAELTEKNSWSRLRSVPN